eukprot:jgi/Chlat1/1501/Chrsp12S02043
MARGGKRHKKEKEEKEEHEHEEDGNAAEEDAAEVPVAAAGPSGRDATGALAPPAWARIEPETKEYYRSLDALIGPGGSVEDDEGKQQRAVLCSNALQEAAGKEVQLASDPDCSRIMENLVKYADVQTLQSFASACSTQWPALSSSPCGSRVAEALLRSLAALKLTSEELKEVLEPLFQAVVEHGTEYASDRFASHVLRTLLAVLSGQDAGSAAHQGSKSMRGGLAAKLQPRRQQPQSTNGGYPGLLAPLVKSFLDSAGDSIQDLCYDTYGSPVLQTFLEAASTMKATTAAIISRIFDSRLAPGMEKFEAVDAARAVELMENQLSSHLVEVVFRVTPDELYGQLVTEVCKGRLHTLALHPTANFVVQSIISSARTARQVRLMVTDLQSHVPKLLSGRRGGVVAALLSACGRLGVCQAELTQAVAQFMTASGHTDTLLPRMVTMQVHEDGESGKLDLSSRRASPLGCAMLQTILGFPTTCSKPFLDAFSALEPTQALMMARDPIASHVVEAFLQGPAGEKLKKKFIRKLIGHFADLGTEAAGSHCVEKCFAWGDLKLKEAITAELVAGHTKLVNSKYGPFLLSKCGVDRYAHHPDEWRARQAGKDKAQKAFAELLNTNKADNYPLAVNAKKHPRHDNGTDDHTEDPYQSNEVGEVTTPTTSKLKREPQPKQEANGAAQESADRSALQPSGKAASKPIQKDRNKSKKRKQVAATLEAMADPLVDAAMSQLGFTLAKHTGKKKETHSLVSEHEDIEVVAVHPPMEVGDDEIDALFGGGKSLKGADKNAKKQVSRTGKDTAAEMLLVDGESSRKAKRKADDEDEQVARKSKLDKNNVTPSTAGSKSKTRTKT